LRAGTIRQSKSILTLVWLATSVFILGGAECPEGGLVGSLLPQPGELNYFPNPRDPLMLTTQSADGATLEIYGQKNDEGYPTAINSFRYQSPDQAGGDGGVWMEFDEKGRATQLTGDDGTTITLDWRSEAVATVTAVDGSGEVQTNFELDFDKGGSGRRQSVDLEPGYSRIGQPTTLEVLHPSDVLQTASHIVNHKADAAAMGRSNTVDVYVRRCGQLIKGANVFVAFSFPNEPTSQVTIAKAQSAAGQYQAELPTVWTPNEIQLAQACDFFASHLGDICSGFGFLPEGSDTLLCAELAGKVDLAAGGPTGEALVILPLCKLGTEAVQFYCATFDASPAPGVPINASGEICAKIKQIEDRAPKDNSVQYQIYAWADVPGVPRVKSEPMFVSAVGDFPEIELSFEDGIAAINSFTTLPTNPAPRQSYVATAELSCIPAGVTIRISVTGSDNFTSSNELVVDADNPNPIIKLSVPGGAATVKDTILVEAVGGIPMITPPFSATVMQLKRDIRIEF
jgi:hypothetical protein